MTGAKLLASVPGRVLADDQKGAGGAGKAANFDIETVLKKAEDLAQGNELIAQVAKEVRQRPPPTPRRSAIGSIIATTTAGANTPTPAGKRSLTQ